MIWIIGSGNMALEYAKILKHKKKTFKVVGRGLLSSSNFTKKTGIPVVSGGIENFLSFNKLIPTYAIVCVNINNLFDVTSKLIDHGVNKILCEKPGALKISQLKILDEKSKIKKIKLYIAYNRRFYTSVVKLKKIINKENGLKSLHFDFTEKSKKIEKLNHPSNVKSKWIIANSAHVIDTAFFLAGMPKEIITMKKGSLNWPKKSSIFSGSGNTKNSVYFSYNANWNVPGNWKIELMTNKSRLLLQPMEELKIINNDLSISKISEKKIDYDTIFKPGLFRMICLFEKNELTDFCTIEHQIKLLKLCNKIAGYKD